MTEKNKDVTVANCPVVLKPGVQPGTLNIEARIIELGFMFAKQETADLIDQIAIATAVKNNLTKWEKAAKQILGKRLGAPTAEVPVVTSGHQFINTYTYSQRTALDTERVRAEMGDEWFNAHCKTTPVLTLKFRPIGEGNGDGGGEEEE